MDRLRRAGMTIILVEQNARMGLEFADWGCVLDLGKAVFEGPSRDRARGPAHPGALSRPAARLRQAQRRMTHLIQILLLGLALGGVYALMASGLTLIFGVMGIVNLAHAAFMTLAAYIAFWAFSRYGLDPILSIVVVMPVMFVLGLAVYQLLFARSFGDPRARGDDRAPDLRAGARGRGRARLPLHQHLPLDHARATPRARCCSGPTICPRRSSMRP